MRILLRFGMQLKIFLFELGPIGGYSQISIWAIVELENFGGFMVEKKK